MGRGEGDEIEVKTWSLGRYKFYDKQASCVPDSMQLEVKCP